MNRKLIELQYNIMFPNDQTSFDQSENYIDFAEHIAKLAVAEVEKERDVFALKIEQDRNTHNATIRKLASEIIRAEKERDELQSDLNEYGNMVARDTATIARLAKERDALQSDIEQYKERCDKLLADRDHLVNTFCKTI